MFKVEIYKISILSVYRKIMRAIKHGSAIQLRLAKHDA